MKIYEQKHKKQNKKKLNYMLGNEVLFERAIYKKILFSNIKPIIKYAYKAKGLLNRKNNYYPNSVLQYLKSLSLVLIFIIIF